MSNQSVSTDFFILRWDKQTSWWGSLSLAGLLICKVDWKLNWIWEKSSYGEMVQVLKQVVQRGCEVSILQMLKNTASSHSCFACHYWTRWSPDVSSNLTFSGNLWLCDSVKDFFPICCTLNLENIFCLVSIIGVVLFSVLLLNA